MHTTRRSRAGWAMLATGGLVAASGLARLGLTGAVASSHREAPLISGAPQYDNTDVYAFVSPDDPDTVTMIANWIPFEEPAGGPNFYPFAKDAQVLSIRNARRYRGDRLLRVAAPHRILDPAAGPLIAVRLRVITHKTLGGIQTDLDGRALGADGRPVPGLYAAGEAAGFGGGGAHGYHALEGTFLGGCLFTGRTVGRALADAL